MLKQNINQDVFVSIIRSKLAKDVLLKLEILNEAKRKWTVESLRIRIHEYITAWEHAEKEKNGTNRIFNGDNNARSDRSQKPGSGTYSNSRRQYVGKLLTAPTMLTNQILWNGVKDKDLWDQQRF